MLPSRLVATTSYSPACSAAMLRMSSTTLPAGNTPARAGCGSQHQHEPRVGNPADTGSANCCQRSAFLQVFLRACPVKA